MTADRNDRLTVAAIGLSAMCLVTVDHEALGHGSVCLLVHGHITLLTSSLFRCSQPSGWIDVGGPAMNLFMGLVALAVLASSPPRFLKARLFLICVAAFSVFWESGYLIDAMRSQSGDLYFFMQFLFGDVAAWQRWIGVAAGLALYVLAMRVTSRELQRIWPDASMSRAVARTAWLSATLGAAIAAGFYFGHGWTNFKDAVLEIGAASFPLLIIPFDRRRSGDAAPTACVARDYGTILFALIVYAAFVATLGRGVGV